MISTAFRTALFAILCAGVAGATLAASPALAEDPQTCAYRDVRLARACVNNASVRAYLRDPDNASVEAYLDVPPLYRGWDPGEEEALMRALGMSNTSQTPAAAPIAAAGPMYPANSPGGVMARINRIASGEYAASIAAERARTPVVSWSPTRIRTAARTAVADKLRDPSSAQFRNVRRLMLENGTSVFCGEVNGRNAYGGYAGFIRFEAGVSDRGSASAQLDSQEPVVRAYFQSAWNQMCGRTQGVPVAF